jgi:hypothetical protein
MKLISMNSFAECHKCRRALHDARRFAAVLVVERAVTRSSDRGIAVFCK